ncbi:uncharacterized protein LOC106161955 [Lingula anatina]|uniref:Uncharacterized protein LOC106161955 n=1 Tax=Lingula anatina TaxID=7574 RepID=A0A1S3I8A8_LINAN|nr:uncharacterized protein LOC106161955 [Lingula anatina]|eukprot:XP_013394492.1 uncharacterized protein LOC106161955 [Lingula anatina]
MDQVEINVTMPTPPTNSTSSDYDHEGALYYVIAVCAVYGFSVFLLVASHIRSRKSNHLNTDHQVTIYFEGMAKIRKEMQHDDLTRNMREVRRNLADTLARSAKWLDNWRKNSRINRATRTSSLHVVAENKPKEVGDRQTNQAKEKTPMLKTSTVPESKTVDQTMDACTCAVDAEKKCNFCRAQNIVKLWTSKPNPSAAGPSTSRKTSEKQTVKQAILDFDKHFEQELKTYEILHSDVYDV